MGRKGRHRDAEFVELLVSIGVAELANWAQASEPKRQRAVRLLAHEVCVLCGRSVVYGFKGLSDMALLPDCRDRRLWPASRHADDLYNLTMAVIEFGQERLMADLQMPELTAEQTARQIAWRLLESFEGTNLYVPADAEYERRERDSRMVRLLAEDGPRGAKRYSYARMNEVARQFGISIAHLYVIVRCVRSLEQRHSTEGRTE